MSDHTEASVFEAIRKTFGAVRTQGDGRRYVVAGHVNNGAGFSFGRTLDAVVFDTWPSKGLALNGIEIKVSKSDLRRELQNPEKSGQFVPFLDTFSLAMPPEVLQGMKDLIPGKWGIYVTTVVGTVRTVRKPLYLHDDGRDRSICDRAFAAAFARALVQRSLSREAEDAAYAEGREYERKQAETEIKNATTSRDNVLEQVKAFEEASGITLRGYGDHPVKIGETVKFVLGGGLADKVRYTKDLRDLGERLIGFADEIEAHSDLLTLRKEGSA